MCEGENQNQNMQQNRLLALSCMIWSKKIAVVVSKIVNIIGQPMTYISTCWMRLSYESEPGAEARAS